jgi:hypothetical protein
MGEARRRRRAYDTLDGGPPSDEKIAIQLEVFSPLVEAWGEDRLYWSAIREMQVRIHRWPTPICGACDYEFSVGEFPPLLYCTRPFIAKAEEFQFIAGAICPRCADLPTDTLPKTIMRHLCEVKPDLEPAPMGVA